MPNNKSVSEKIVSGLNKTASVIGALSSVGSAAYKAAKVAAPIIRAIIRVIGNPKSWYLKYGEITPAANEGRPMEPIFNTLLTRNATFGVPKFVDVEVSWNDFANTFMMDQVVANALRSIRKHLKSNLPYSSKLLKAYIVNSVALIVMAKQVERDVHWAQYTGSSDPRWQKMYIKKPLTIGRPGIVDLVDETYLNDENWAYTSSVYNKFKDLYNRNVFVPAAIGEFLSHYFGSLFVSSDDGHNDQYIRLKMQNIDWYDMSDGEGGTLTNLNVSNLTLDDVMSMLNEYSQKFAIVIADLEKAVALSAASIAAYESYVYYLVYDKTFLQALINGYTSEAAMTDDKYIRMDRMPGVDDDLTQFLFLGAIQPPDRSLSNIKAIKIVSMTYKLDSNAELEWPAEFGDVAISEVDNPVIKRDEPFGLQLTSDVTVSTRANITVNKESEENTVILTETQTTDLQDPQIEISATSKAGSQVNAGTVTRQTDTNGRLVPQTSAIAGWMFPLFAIDFTATDEENESPLKVGALVAYKDYNPNLGVTAPGSAPFTPVFKCIYATIPAAEKDRALQNLLHMPTTGYIDLYGSNEQNVNDIITELVSKALDINEVGIQASNNSVTADFYIGCSGVISVSRTSWSFSVSAAAPIGVVDPKTLLGGQALAEQNTVALKWYPLSNALLACTGKATYTSFNDLIDSSMDTALAAVTAYAADVFDYHIPFVLKTSYVVNVNGIKDIDYTSSKILVKENYIPYFYNILDLIPVLYAMFSSLFSFEDKRNTWGKSNYKPHGKDKQKDGDK